MEQHAVDQYYRTTWTFHISYRTKAKHCKRFGMIYSALTKRCNHLHIRFFLFQKLKDLCGFLLFLLFCLLFFFFLYFSHQRFDLFRLQNLKQSSEGRKNRLSDIHMTVCAFFKITKFRFLNNILNRYWHSPFRTLNPPKPGRNKYTGGV